MIKKKKKKSITIKKLLNSFGVLQLLRSFPGEPYMSDYVSGDNIKTVFIIM